VWTRLAAWIKRRTKRKGREREWKRSGMEGERREEKRDDSGMEVPVEVPTPSHCDANDVGPRQTSSSLTYRLMHSLTFRGLLKTHRSLAASMVKAETLASAWVL